mgnify:CR=1 FL=1
MNQSDNLVEIRGLKVYFEVKGSILKLTIGVVQAVDGVDLDIERGLDEAFAVAATRRPVIVDVAVDYSKRTRFTEGILKTNLERFDLGTKVRLVGRALWRRVTG